MTNKNKLLSGGRIACFWIALISSLAWAQTSAPYADLVAKSASLSLDQKSKAAQLFSTGFSLWQGGDFQSALLAFRDGLDIDPANPQANFYYADCLRQSRQRTQAIVFFERASMLGAGSPEAFKAKTALSELAKPIPFSEMSRSERLQFYEGIWAFEGYEENVFTITRDLNGQLFVSGEVKCFLFCPGMHYKNLTLLEDGSIQFGVTNAVTDANHYRFRLVGPTRMEGVWNSPGSGQYNQPMAAVKK